MAGFKYEAKNSAGRVVKGTIEAGSEDAARAKLKAQGLTVNTLATASGGFKLSLPMMGGVSVKDLKTFTQQFSTMVDAGLPLVQILEILGSQGENARFKAALQDVKATVEGGSTFSEALAKHPKIFDELFVNLVAAGEMGGILDTIMKRLSEYIEKRQRLQQQIKGALAYPVGILVATLLIVFVMLKWVIPTFQSMFDDFGGELPALTQGVIDLSEAFQANWYLYTGAVIGVFLALKAFASTKKGTFVLDKLFLIMPIVGPVVRKIAVARFTRTMGTLLASGVPILDAMDTVSKAAGNVHISNAILYAKDKIAEGRNMSEPLAEKSVFPGMVVQMIAVGEQTGALDIMCTKIADFYDEEVDVAVGALTSLMEPLMMVVIGGIVGTMLISMYLPIFSMAGSAGE